MVPSDKRRHVRTPVTLIVDYDGADDFLGDYTENLSHGGTFIHTARAFEVGAVVQLVLSFPGLLEPVAVEGVVRWARIGEGQGVGVEFVPSSGCDRLAAVAARIERRDPRTVARVIEVLVVEDNRHISELIRSGLEASGRRSFSNELAFTVATAGDGAEALALLRAQRFDVAIIDVYLPVIGGPMLIQQTRRELGLVALPIIALSGGGESARLEALEAGANLFLDKPMRLRQVIESMRQLMDLGAAGPRP